MRAKINTFILARTKMKFCTRPRNDLYSLTSTPRNDRRTDKKTCWGHFTQKKILEGISMKCMKPEMGIYKRKQESKKTRTRPRKKKKTFFFLDHFLVSWLSSCFLSFFLFFLIFLFSYFLVFFYKFSPLIDFFNIENISDRGRYSHSKPPFLTSYFSGPSHIIYKYIKENILQLINGCYT